MMKTLRCILIGLLLFSLSAAWAVQDSQATDSKDFYDEQESEELLEKGLNWEELLSSLLGEGDTSLFEFVSKTLTDLLVKKTALVEENEPGEDVTGLTEDIEGDDGSDIVDKAQGPKETAEAEAQAAAGRQAPAPPDIDSDDYGSTNDQYGKDASDSAEAAAVDAKMNAGMNAKGTAGVLTDDALAMAESHILDSAGLEEPGETPDIEPDKPGNANTGKGPSIGTPKKDNIVISGNVFGPISAGRGADKVTVKPQGTVISLAFDPQPQTIGIDGEEDDDTIINNGSVSAIAISQGNVLKNAPANGSDKKEDTNNDLEEKKGALAVAIVGGDGDDGIDNTGTIAATAVSNALDFIVGASGLKVEVGASDAITDAIGIYDNDGDTTVTNSGDITATATSTALKAELSANIGISASDDAATAIATSVGMQTGDGDDKLTNEGNITAVSTSYVGVDSYSGSGGLNALAPRFSPASAHTAEAYSTGFGAGGGDNIINNTGNITAVSTAVSDVITLDIRANGAAKAISTSNTKSEASALITGDGNDTITNDGAMTAVATSVAHAQTAAVSKSGKAPLSKSSWGGEAYAESTATGFQTGAGEDTITNSGGVTAVATSVTATESASVSAKGPVTVDSTSRSEATTTGINAGSGNDTIYNTGDISAVSTATAHTIEFAFSDEGNASASQNWFEKAIHQGGPQSEAVAVGITADGVEESVVKDSDLTVLPKEIEATASYSKLGASGDDIITNESAITAVATAISTAGAGSISLKGAASSDAISKATSNAKGLDAGAGNDIIHNYGDITAVSTANADSVAFSYTGSKKGKVSVSATAEADATGVSADGDPSSSTLQTGLIVNEQGITSTSSYETIAATGNDTIVNTGNITAVATAASVSGAVSVAVKEANTVSAKARAKASALGLGGGNGDDSITNYGATTAVSTATAGALEISYAKDKDTTTKKGLLEQAVLKGGAEAEAKAFGIRADGTDVSTMTEASLHIDTDSIDETFHHETTASGGNDTVNNYGAVTAVATAVSGETSASITAKGGSKSEATSKADALAEGIKAGGGDDLITNTGDITAVSTATAFALEASFAKGNADSSKNVITEQIIESGAVSNSQAVGLKGDGEDASHIVDQSLSITTDSINTSFRYEKAASSGSDEVYNLGNITAVSTAASGSGSAAVSIDGGGSATAKSEAKSSAMGVDLGAGDDYLDNSGNITAVSTATALSAGISYSGGKPEDKPDAKAADAKGGSANAVTSAVAEVTGISGDGGLAGSITEASLDTEFSLDITEEGVEGALETLDLQFSHEGVAATGDDFIYNDGAVTAVATAVSGSSGIGVSIKGANEAAAKSTAQASALGIDAGAGDDLIINTGAITAVSTAAADALEVSFSKEKDADTTKGWLTQAFSNNGVTAESEAIGIRGDSTRSSTLTETVLNIGPLGIVQGFYHETAASSGADTINNSGAVTAVSTAAAGEVSAAISVDGASQADATASAVSRAQGIDAGAGDDTVTNTGDVVAVSTAMALAFEAAFSEAKDADATRKGITKQIVEYGSKAESEAVGISGDSEAASHIVEENLYVGTDHIHVDAGYEYAASSGMDTITNQGNVAAVSTALSSSTSLGLSIKGDAKSDAQSQAVSTAIGIDAGAGDDKILNGDIEEPLIPTEYGNITAVSTAAALGLGVSFSENKGGGANTSVSAEAEATGISADGQLAGDKFYSSVDIDVDGISAGMHNDYIAATGNDTISNTGAVTAVSTAASGAGAFSITIKEANEAAAKSTSKALATGIDAGAGNDTITNIGEVTAVSTAAAAALDVSFAKEKDASTTQGFLKQAISDNGVTAEAESIGIRGDGTNGSHLTDLSLTIDETLITQSFHHESLASSGNDTITNSGDVTSVATAASGEISVGVSIDGAAKADATSTAIATAEGIRGGSGDDHIVNQNTSTDSENETGNITAVATATAFTLDGTFSEKKSADSTRNYLTKQIVDYGALAESSAVGIKADGDAASHIVDQSLSIGEGHVIVGAGYEYAPSTGSDIVENDSAITAVSTAVSGDGSGALSLKGGASADAKSRADAYAAGVDAGAGDDGSVDGDTITYGVDNSGDITAVATATAFGLGLGISDSKGSVANADAGARAESVGISGDGNLKGGSAGALLDVTTEGLTLTGKLEVNHASGDDAILNSGNVTAVSTAVSGSGSVAVSLSGAASANMSSSAESIATALGAGAGKDIVTNTGNLTAVSSATAAAFSAGVSGKGQSGWNDFKSLFAGGTDAKATAVGIQGDGNGSDINSESSLSVDFNDLDVHLATDTDVSLAGDNDQITNDGNVTAVAVATSPVFDADIKLDGKATAVSTAKADAKAVAIDGGVGDDTITNRGELEAVSVSTAAAVVVALSKNGALAADTIWDGGTEATSSAVGIMGDGEGSNYHLAGNIDITDQYVGLGAEFTSTAATGDDVIINEESVTAISVATVPSIGLTVSAEGTGAAVTTATTDAVAAGIAAGAGNDKVTNTGDITSTAVSTANTLNVGVSKGINLSGDSLWNGGTEAFSEAVGISGDGKGQDLSASGDIFTAGGNVYLGTEFSSKAAGGSDIISNDGSVVATSVATAPALTAAVSIDSMSAAVSTSEARSLAVGIDAGAGTENIHDKGEDGFFSDVIENTGEITATSVATAASANIAASKGSSLAGSSLWDGATSATADAVGISGDGEGTDLTLSGAIWVSGGDVVMGTSMTSSVAGGDDFIDNSGEVTATSVATVPSLGVAVSVNGSSAAVSKAEATANAVGIDAGTGNDLVRNSNDVTASSVATAVDLNVSVSKNIALAGNGLWDGATSATAEAIGISGDGNGRDMEASGSLSVVDDNVSLSAKLESSMVSGDDTIENSGNVTATSVATAPGVAVAVGVNGGSAALSTAEAKSVAMGIEAGAGSDTVDNTGEIVATAVSTAATGNVSVGKSAALATGGFWDGGATAVSEAVGISADGKGNDLELSGNIAVKENDVQIDTSLASTVAGGDDAVTNERKITATSVSIAPTLDVAVAIQGGAMASSKSTAEARAVGVDGGTGDDSIVNTAEGEIVSTAVASAGAVSVAGTSQGLTLAGPALWDGGMSATSEAIGISGDGKGADTLATGSISTDDKGVSLAASLTRETVAGEDTITNAGIIEATSVAVTPSAAISIAGTGVAGALATSTADATAVGIDGGAGNDQLIENTETGEIVSTAVASANSLSVAGTGGGLAIAVDSIWDGGTTAISKAVGISGDGEGDDLSITGSIDVVDKDVLVMGGTSLTTVTGDDYIVNDGSVTATSVSESLSAAVSVAVEGVALGAAASSAESSAVAIDAGAGGDKIENSGELTATSVANANVIAVSFTTAGVTGASGGAFDGGSGASAEAIGISADGKGEDTYISGFTAVNGEGEGIDFSAGDLNLPMADEDLKEGVYIGSDFSTTAVTGDDEIDNSEKIVATSVAFTPAVGVSISAAGVAVAGASSEADARAIAIDAGAGDDKVLNTGELVSTSVASANSIAVSGTAGGVVLSTDSFWDGGTTAISEAVGIGGDGSGQDVNSSSLIAITEEQTNITAGLSSNSSHGNDLIDNSGNITTTSVAEAFSANIAYTTIGVAGAVSTATAESRSVGIDSGAGNDDIINNPDAELVSTSVAVAVPISAAVLVGPEGGGGVGFSSSGATAVSEAAGIMSDGQVASLEISESLTVTDTAGLDQTDIVTQNLTIISTTTPDDVLPDIGRSFDDTIDNSGDITVTSVAEVTAPSVSFSLIGATGVVSSSDAQSRAVAIDTGAGGDQITNFGELTATSIANANTVSVSIAPLGGALAADTVWDGGTKAKSEAVGISGDGIGADYTFNSSISVGSSDVSFNNSYAGSAVTGDDDIFNYEKITATSVAVAPSIGVALAVGPAATMATAQADSRAAAIDAGAGSDDVVNAGELVATSVANADAVSLTFGGITATSNDGFWSGGTTAGSKAVGISLDGDGLNETVTFELKKSDGDIIMNTGFASRAATGGDTLDNTGNITATSVAVAPSYTAAVSAGGAAAIAAATAKADAVAIDGGAGGDEITNSGELTATAVANADTISVSSMVGPLGASVAGNGFFSGGVNATSNAAGISGDGLDQNLTVTGSLIVKGLDDVKMDNTVSSTSAGGTDTITNTGGIEVTSVAVAPAVTNSLALNGVAAAISTATAHADGVGIDGGAGEDTIINDIADDGELEVTSVAVAAAVNTSMGLGGIKVASDAVWQGGTTATAKSIGISGDSLNPEESLVTSIEAVNDVADISTIYSAEYAGGKDTITNESDITATSVVVAPSISSTFTVAGVAAALSTATAESTAIAIDGGAGSDTITNRGKLNTVAVANADAVSLSVTGVGVSVSSDAVWNGGTTATATSVGISGDSLGNNESITGYMNFEDGTVDMGIDLASEAVSGNDSIYNYDEITAAAVSVTPSIGIAANGIGVAAAVSTSTANADAAAINAGDGSDYVYNEGKLTATSVANADAVSIAGSVIGISAAGTSAWDGGTKANAEAVGIKGDGIAKETTDYSITKNGDQILIREVTSTESTGGDDTIMNHGDITAEADAVTVTVDVALSGIGVAGAVSTSTAEAYAAAIDAGAGSDTVTNDANLMADAEATAVSVGVGLSAAGGAGSLSAVWDGGTKASSKAVGISGDGNGEKETVTRGITINGTDVVLEDEVQIVEAVGGNDTITNTGRVEAYSTATSPEVQVATSLIGISEAISTSTAEAKAAAIDGGAGNDIINTGSPEITNEDLISQATATAVAVGVEVTGLGDAGGLDSMWEGGTESKAVAIGIDGGEGSDQITNFQSILANSHAETVSVETSADIAGVAVAVSTAKAVSETTGIYGGDGADTIASNASILSVSEAEATGVSVAVNLAGYAKTDTSVLAEAFSAGLDGGEGNDSITNNNILYSGSKATANAAEINVNLLGASYTGDTAVDGQTKANASTFGIRGGGGADGLFNNSLIYVSSEAEASAGSVDVKIAGYNSANAGTFAESVVVGMDGGSGDDTIDNNGSILGNSTANAGSTVVAVDLVGATNADLSNTAMTDGAGMDGGDSNDVVTNNGYINMYAKADAPATTVGVTLAGAVNADAATTLEANSSGMRGGSGTDILENNGTVIVNTYGEGYVTGVTVNLAGAGDANASTSVTAKAQGMEGESGNDTLTNNGILQIKGDAHGYGSAVTVTLAGKSDADASLSVTSDVTGMSGGTGADKITNTNSGMIDVVSLAVGKAGSVSVTLAGAAPGEAGTETSAYGTGIQGGSGNNTIINHGSIYVLADAGGDASSVSVDLAGSAKASVESKVASVARGIASGAGADWVDNSESITAKGVAGLVAKGTSVNLAGTSKVSTGGEAAATAYGIDTGDGNDIIINTGIVDVDAESSIIQSGYGFTLAGSTASGSNLMTSEAEAVGVELGSGNNTLTSNYFSDIDVDATATLFSSSSSTGIFGTSASGVESGAKSSAYGVRGGYGNDTIYLWGNLDVNAKTEVTSTGTAFEFGGTGSDSGKLTSESMVVGIDGGAGSNWLENHGYVYVKAQSELSLLGDTDVVFGVSSSSSNTYSNARATGIFTGGSSDHIENWENIVTYAYSDAESKNSSYVFGGASSSDSLLTAIAMAAGIDSGSGNDYILNGNYIYTLANANILAEGGADSTFGSSASSGSVTASVTSYGIESGYGNDTVENSGYIYARGYSDADATRITGTGWLYGKDYAKATAYAYTTGYGIDAGSGANTVLNNGYISVHMNSNAYTSADGDGADIWNGDSTSDSYAYAKSVAYGVFAGGSSDFLTNDTGGTIDVEAYAHSAAYGIADGDGLDGDGYSEADARSYARAYGISSGSGNDTILNHGDLTVTADTHAITYTRVDGDNTGDATAKSRSVGRSYAYGIYASGGNNYIENNGSISATAISHTSASANPDGGWLGSSYVTETHNNTAYAVGILTGSGNDTIINSGSISTREKIYKDGDLVTNRRGVGIDSGAGADSVALNPGSSIYGDVVLGTGNDTISFSGNAYVSGMTSGEGGEDTLILTNTGNVAKPQQGFETVVSYGNNAISTAGRRDIENFELNAGVLRISEDYQFDGTDTLTTTIHPDGTVGTLRVDGNAALDGKLTVNKTFGIYFDDTVYPIVSSDALAGDFTQTHLPDSSPIVTFSKQKTDTNWNLWVDVASFTTVADTDSEKSVAAYLDRLSPMASGELYNVIAVYQGLPMSEFDMAFASVNPEPYSSSAREYMDTTIKSFNMVQKRLNALRTNAIYASYADRVRAQGSFAGLNGIPQTRFGYWTEGFSTEFYEDETRFIDSFSYPEEFLSHGFDVQMVNNLILGFGRDYSQISTTTALTDGMNTAEGAKDFIYSSVLHGDYYMNLASFWGNESYSQQRDIGVGMYEGATVSDHQSDSFASYVELGRLISSHDSILQPFASLRYMNLEEDGFTESGGGALALNIEDASRESLTSHLGLRASKLWVFKEWTVMPEVSLAWRYRINPVDYSTTASFVSMPEETFVVEGEEEDEHALNIGVGLNIGKLGKFDFSVNYNGEVPTDNEEHELGFRLIYSF